MKKKKHLLSVSYTCELSIQIVPLLSLKYDQLLPPYGRKVCTIWGTQYYTWAVFHMPGKEALRRLALPRVCFDPHQTIPGIRIQVTRSQSS
jgi:hypothetical protein